MLTRKPPLLRWFLTVLALGLSLGWAGQDPKGPSHGPFHPRDAKVSDEREHRYVWRERCGNNIADDHQLAGGLEWEGDNRDYIALGEAQMRGRRRGGLILLSFPDGNRLRASWKVEFARGDDWTIEYGLTDSAAAHSINGLRFTVLATDGAGKEHKLIERTLKPGDWRVHKETIRFPFAVKRVSFLHDNLGSESWDVLWVLPQGLMAPRIPEERWASTPSRKGGWTPPGNVKAEDLEVLRLAVEDLRKTFGRRYPRGEEFLVRLETLRGRISGAESGDADTTLETFRALRREALTANPLVSSHPLLYVSRSQYVAVYHAIDTLYEVGEATQGRYHPGGALKALDLMSGETRTLVEAPEGLVRSPCIHFSGQKILFSMRRNAGENFHLFEVSADGTGLQQLTFAPDVSDFDPIYLPDESIVFCSTREPKYNMCSQDIGANLYRMDVSGANIHQITKSTLFENQPSLLPDGRILYKRWEYVDRNFGDGHGFWAVRPDGTSQSTIYGNSTADPAAVYYPRVIPDSRGRILCILSTHHHNMWGPLAIVDPGLATDGKQAILRTWPAGVRDNLSESGQFDCDKLHAVLPRYETPFPLSGKHFLCSRMTGRGQEMGLYLIDTFGNEVLLHSEPPGCYSPLPLAPSLRPPVIPPHRDFDDGKGLVYIMNVYLGTHLGGVRSGSVKRIRIVESPEKRGWSSAKWYGQGFMAPGMNWHDFTAKRVLGTVPVEEDGSAYFAMPSDTFVYFQLLDEAGQMIQSMRSGTVVQSGERVGCVGCHESRLAAPPPFQTMPLALRRPPSAIAEWHGSPRIFNYLEEVQPVLDRHCLPCHDFGGKGGEKLVLAGDKGVFFNASYTELWRKGAIRAVGAGPARIQEASTWGARVSKLVQVLRDGHHDVDLPAEALDRLVTWIDINAPYYPSYYSAYPDHAGGRCPLDNRQLGRLGQLIGVDFNADCHFSGNRGPHVSFDRPELSPGLSRLGDASSPQYREALSIIQKGQRALSERPRADMRDFRPCDADVARERKYFRSRATERASRMAIREGRQVYDSRPGRPGSSTSAE